MDAAGEATGLGAGFLVGSAAGLDAGFFVGLATGLAAGFFVGLLGMHSEKLLDLRAQWAPAGHVRQERSLPQYLRPPPTAQWQAKASLQPMAGEGVATANRHTV